MSNIAEIQFDCVDCGKRTNVLLSADAIIDTTYEDRKVCCQLQLLFMLDRVVNELLTLKEDLKCHNTKLETQ